MAAPIDAGSIYSDVRIRLDKLNGDIKSVQTSLDKITKASKKTGKDSQKGLGKFFSFIKTSGVGSFLALGAVIAGTVKFLKDSEAAASDAQEVYSKFDTVFESIQDSANNAADSFAESFGVAGSTARELIGATGDLLVGMGATEDTALDLSMQVQELAADLASFSNVQGGTKRASEALTAALLGETERMKLLGVVIRQSDVQARLAEKGLKNLTGQALMLAKAQITLEMATEQSGKAMGDSQKTFYSAANVTKRLKETQKALREEVGIGIVEAMTPLRIATDKLITSFTIWLKKNREIKDAMKEINDTGESTVGSITTLEAALKIATKALADDSTGIIESVAVYESRITAIQDQINAIKALDAAKLNTARFEEQYAKEISVVNARLLLKAKQEEEAAKFTAERIRQQGELGKAFEAIAEKQALYGDEFDARAAKEQAVRQVLNEMIEFGFTAEGAGIKRILKQYEEYFTTVAKGKTEIIAAGEDYLSIITQERDGIISVDEARKEAAEKHFQRARDNLLNDLNTQKITTESYLEGIQLIDEAEEENAENEKQRLADKEANVKQYVDMAFSLWSSLTSALSDLYTAEADKQIAEINRVLEAQLLAIDTETAAVLESLGLQEDTKIESLQKKLDAAIEAGDTETAAQLQDEIDRTKILEEAEATKNDLIKIAKQETAQIEYEANLASWKMKKLGLIASGAQAAISTFVSAGGWPWGVVPAGIMASITKIQLNSLKEQKPVAPSFATGGIVLPSSGGSLINVAENGSPELMLNSGASGQAMMQEFANQIVDKMGGGQVFYLTLPNGKVLAEAVAPSFNNGTVALRLT